MKKITALVNPTPRSMLGGYKPQRAWILCFGAYGDTRLLVYAWSLEDALDECIDWISENAPGLLCNDAVSTAYESAIESGFTADQALAEALTDVTTGGNCGDHILSWEWGIVGEDLTPKEIADFYHGRQ